MMMMISQSPPEKMLWFYSLRTALSKNCTVWEHSLSGKVWTKCPTRPDTQGAPRGGCYLHPNYLLKKTNKKEQFHTVFHTVYVLLASLIHNFTSITNRFRATRHFEKKAPNYLQITLNTTYFPEFPYFAPFYSAASHCRVTGYFKTGKLNDPKCHSHMTMSKFPHICVTSDIESKIAGFFVLQYQPCFELQAIWT